MSIRLSGRSRGRFGGRGLLDGELPLRPDLSVEAERVRRLPIMDEREETRAACCCVVANAVLAYWQGARVHYSRDNSFYAAVRAGVPSWFSRSTVVAAVDLLAVAGLLDVLRTAPSPSARHRSRFSATPHLIQAVGLDHISGLVFEEAPPVILRCREDRRALEPLSVLRQAEMVEFNALTLDVRACNEFLASFEISLRGDAAQALPTGLLKIGDTCVNPRLRRYHRVFNGDMQHGGRWYGPWWQSVPSAVRPSLLIDGEPTVEIDYAACQLRLMFSYLGLPDPLNGEIRGNGQSADLYSIDGVHRETVKLALLMLTNAPSQRSARRALAAQLDTIPPKSRGPEADRIMGAVRRRFTALEPLWCSGIGLRLQRTDSDVCAQVQLDMRSAGLPVLSIHDSFACWERTEPDLRACMRNAFEKVWHTNLQGKAACASSSG